MAVWITKRNRYLPCQFSQTGNTPGEFATLRLAVEPRQDGVTLGVKSERHATNGHFPDHVAGKIEGPSRSALIANVTLKQHRQDLIGFVLRQLVVQ